MVMRGKAMWVAAAVPARVNVNYNFVEPWLKVNKRMANSFGDPVAFPRG